MRGLTGLRGYWRLGLIAGLLVGLMLLARSAASQNPQGVAGLFLFSLFISIGFLLFGRQRFEAAPSTTPADDQHSV